MKEYLDILKTIETNYENIESDRSIIRVPVTLTIIDHYYRTQVHYRYTDEYLFKDTINVYDFNNYDLNNDYEEWLKDLKNTKKHSYISTPSGRYNDDYHLIKSHEHFDWTSNGGNINLRNILQLDIEEDRIKPFSPVEKKLYMNRDHRHKKRIDIYSFYFNSEVNPKDRSNEINYGILKANPTNIRDLLKNGYSYNKDSCTKARREYKHENLRYTRMEEEGYEGVCKWFNWEHGGFNYRNEKWGTPYVAYRYKQKEWKSETYYYLLGDLSDRMDRIEVINSKNNKNAWFVDYGDYFRVDLVDNKLKVSLNDSLIKNKRDFLSISSAFNFELSFKSNRKSKSVKFTIKDLLEGKVVSEESENTLFSDFSVKVTSNKNGVKIMNNSNSLIYRVDINPLLEKNLVLKGINFFIDDAHRYFPSELSSINRIKDYFFYYSYGNNRVKVEDEDLINNLRIRIEANDISGIITVTYYDPYDKQEKTIEIENMKKLPKFRESFINASSLEEAKERLYKEFNSDYFWSNVRFVPKKTSLFDSRVYYRLENLHRKKESKNQWDFKDLVVSIPNKDNLSLLIKKEIPKTYSHLSDFFELSSVAKNHKIGLHNYSYSLIEKTDDQIVIQVKLERGESQGRKEYSINYRTGEVKEIEIENDEYYDNLFEIFCGASGVIVGGAGTSLAMNSPKLLSILRKRRIL